MRHQTWRTPLIMIVACRLISMTGFGIRATFGLFLEPMTSSNDWSRETYGLAMALQNLFWGIGLPLAAEFTITQDHTTECGEPTL